MIKTVRFEDVLAGESAEMQQQVAILAEELRKEITLRKLREGLGETQTGLAKKTGLTQAQVSRVEAGADHKISTIGKVVSGLGGRLRMVAEMPDGNYSIAFKGKGRGFEIRGPQDGVVRESKVSPLPSLLGKTSSSRRKADSR